MPTPLIIIITLFILNWIIRILIRKNPQNKSLIKVSFLISFSMIAYTIYYFIFSLFFILSLIYQMIIFQSNNSESCLRAFKFNNITGILIFLFIFSFSNQ